MDTLDKDFLERLQCPSCRRGDLSIAQGRLVCQECEEQYEVVDGIPILLPPQASSDGDKMRQSKYYDEDINHEFEIDRPHGCGRIYESLIHYKLSKAHRRMGKVKGCPMLNVCCGSGMDAEFFARQDAEVVGLDISLENVQRAMARSSKYQFEMHGVVGDAECLPFKPDAFDFTFVHDGLHHLPNPMMGIREMCRVASRKMCIVEPARAFGTQVMIKLGVSYHYEDAGNFVYRFTEEEFRAVAGEMGGQNCAFERYFMYYKHEPGWIMRLFSLLPFFPIYRATWGGG